MTANNSVRLCLLASTLGEGAVSVVVDAEEHSAACPSKPRVLIAETCSIGPGHDTVIVFGFPFESLIRKDTVWQGVATDRMCSCTRPHVCPGDRLGVLQKDTTSRSARWPHQAITVAWSFSRRSVSLRGHHQRMCSSSSGSSLQNRHKRDSAPRQSNCSFCVQTQPQ